MDQTDYTVSRTMLTFAEIGIVGLVETYGGASRFAPNLHAAFAGESQARNTYTYFAEVAREEGFR